MSYYSEVSASQPFIWWTMSPPAIIPLNGWSFQRPQSQYNVHNTTSGMQRTVTFDATGSVEIDYYTQGETNFDGLYFYLNGEQTGTLISSQSGISGTFFVNIVGTGDQTVGVAYRKDGSITYGFDTGLITALRAIATGNLFLTEDFTTTATFATGTTPANWTTLTASGVTINADPWVIAAHPARTTSTLSIPNEGIGSSEFSGTFNTSSPSLTIISGSATSSNYAWNQYTNQSSALYISGSTNTTLRLESIVSGILSQTINPLNPSSSFSVEVIWRQFGANAFTNLFSWQSPGTPFYGWVLHVPEASSVRFNYAISYVSGVTNRGVSYYLTKNDVDCNLPIENISNTGSWHHIVFIQDRVDKTKFPNQNYPFRIFYDGCPFDFSSVDNAAYNVYVFNPASATFGTTTQRLFIGQITTGYSNNGLYQNLAVYTRSLSYDEVQSHYAAIKANAPTYSGSWDYSGTVTHSTIQTPGKSAYSTSTGSTAGQDPRTSKLNQGIN